MPVPSVGDRRAVMIVLVTDFGVTGPYTGQVKAVLAAQAPGVPVIDLFADAPRFDPRATAYLLATYAGEFPSGAVFLCVVDPDVGGARRPLIIQANDQWFVGPDNGLFELVIRRARTPVRAWCIDERPRRLSATFHGRDLFAPVAAALARGEEPAGRPIALDAMERHDWPDDLAEVIYIDGYGNAMTGLRAATVAENARLSVAGVALARARTYADMPPGQAFWYENSSGLLEIAVNRGHAARALTLAIGTPVTVSTGESRLP